MPTSTEASERESAVATPSNPFGSSASRTPAAEATNAKQLKEPNDDSDLGTDYGKKVKDAKTTTAKKPVVRKSTSATPSRTRSGLIRQPSKRTRTVLKPTKRKSEKEPFAAASTSCAATISSKQSENIAQRFSALSLQNTSGQDSRSQNPIMPRQNSLFTNSFTSSALIAPQQNLYENNFNNTMNAPPSMALQPRCPSFNQAAGFSFNSVGTTRNQNLFHHEQRHNVLSANAQPFHPQAHIPFGSLTTQAVPYHFSGHFQNNYRNHSVPYLSNVNNTTFSQQNNSHQAPTFMFNNNVTSFNVHLPNANNNTVTDIVLSDSQVAARQAISKDLPNFSGRPEEWPIFITNYMQSTERCGFTEQENLIRLQKSLKG